MLKVSGKQFGVTFRSKVAAKKRQATRREAVVLRKSGHKIWLFIVSVCFSFAVIFGAGYWLLETNRYPIESIQLTGAISHTDPETLKSSILPFTQAGFFALNVGSLQQQLLTLPWVKQVDIRRVWPDQLIVHVVEHQPSALWNDVAVISDQAVLFSPPQKDLTTLQLPKLFGPSNKHVVVWEQYRKMEEIISPLQLQLTTIELAQRGAWQVKLDNGIHLKLGTQDVLVRLRGFVEIYQQALQQQSQQIAYVDLRYSNGMAIGWATNTKASKK